MVPYFPTLSKLHSSYESCLKTPVKNLHSSMYRLLSIVMDMAIHRPLKPVSFKTDKTEKRSFLKLLLDNKGLDTLNLRNAVKS